MSRDDRGDAVPETVSVVVPVRNRPELLAQALSSLISQDFPAERLEIVVCDDGSTDDIASVTSGHESSFPLVRLLRQPAVGPAAARNLGVRATESQIVVFVDSDVIADRRMLTQLVKALDDHPEWQGAEAALKPIGNQNGILWDAPDSSNGGHYHTAAIAYRRAALIAAGGFDEAFELPACEDVELAMRILSLGKIGFVADAIAWHPRRPVTARTHWRWRRHWYYEMILAVRYGILAFPGKPCGNWPRLRLALAAVATLPAGRLLAAIARLRREPAAATRASFYAMLDVVCGVAVLPKILWAAVPPRRNYLEG